MTVVVFDVIFAFGDDSRTNQAKSRVGVIVRVEENQEIVMQLLLHPNF
jgi:hypothetical protein